MPGSPIGCARPRRTQSACSFVVESSMGGAGEEDCARCLGIGAPSIDISQAGLRLGNIATRPIEAAVVFDTEGPLQTAELRLHISRGEVLVAKAEAEEHRTALDRAEDKLRKQLEKASARPRRARPSEANPL